MILFASAICWYYHSKFFSSGIEAHFRLQANSTDWNYKGLLSHFHQIRYSAIKCLTAPNFFQELKHLVLEAADGFLFVADCETSQIMYVSDTVTAVLSQVSN